MTSVLDYLNLNKGDNSDLGTVTLNQGINFKKYQKKITNNVKSQNLLFEGFKGLAGNVSNDNINAKLAIQQTHKLIDETDQNVTNQLAELDALQTKFNTILTQYNGSNSNLMGATDTYVQGTNMQDGEKYNTNVVVNTVVSNPQSSYVGCYADTESRAMTGTSAMSGQYVTLDQCKQSAADGGYKYFGLQDYKAKNQTGWCSVSNSLSQTQKYGPGMLDNAAAIWSSGTAGTGANNMTITGDGRIVVQTAEGEIKWQSDNAPAECTWGGNVNLGSVVGSYGGNCVGKPKGIDCGNPSSTESYGTDGIVGNLNNYIKNAVNTNISKGITNFSYSALSEYSGDPAFCCAKTVNYSYQCGGFPFKSGEISAGSNIDFNCSDEITKCKFFLSLQTDGNMCLYRGTPEDNKGSVWCSYTNGKQQKPNSNWAASKGKYGLDYMIMGQILGSEETISSSDGSLLLVMQSSGDLVLYTSDPQPNCTKGQQTDNMYGGGLANAVYEMDRVGNPAYMGAVGYIDDKDRLSIYPGSMFNANKEPTYNQVQNVNKWGNDIDIPSDQRNNSTVELCKEISNSLGDQCLGFVFDKVNNICYPKNKEMIKGVQTYESVSDVYYKNPTIKNNASCTKRVDAVDAVQYAKYQWSGMYMSNNTVCGLQKATQSQNINRDALKIQLANIADEIVNKITYVESLNSQLNNQMGIDKTVLDQTLQKYQKLGEQYTQYKLVDSANINGILSDSDIVVLQENYQYLFWSILAIAIVIITINVFKKKANV
jgi:hypothetical protein